VLLTGGSWQLYLQTTIGVSNRSQRFTVSEPESPLPSISGYTWSPVNPASSQSFGGTISGSNFANGALVFFCISGTSSCTQLNPGQVRVVDQRTINISNVTLASGTWQFYVRTTMGNSSRSNGFTVFTPTGGPIQPTLLSVSWVPLVPLSTSALNGTLRGTNFVLNLTKVFACTYPSNNCVQLPAESIKLENSNEINLTNVRLAKGIWQLYVETPNGVTNRTRTFNVM